MTALPAEVMAAVRRGLPALTPTAGAEALGGGNLNHVWRLPARPAPVIIKQAPPYIASQPDIPLDPSRLGIESRALGLLDEAGALASLCNEEIRPPRLLHVDTEANLLVMEDLGPLPDLAARLARPDAPAARLGERLGRFLAGLHQRSAGDRQLARDFDNRAMQQTRYQVQYAAIGDLCARAGLERPDHLGSIAEALGRRFLEPGLCLTMGDLWPASILVDEDRLRLIDWELAHYGQPAQDIGHLAAHCWMQAQRAGTSATREAWQHFWKAALAAYLGESDTNWQSRWQQDQALPARQHAGAEILMRVLGPFSRGYLYDGLHASAAPVNQALHQAVHCLLGGEDPWFQVR